jgi:hypothetical protein
LLVCEWSSRYQPGATFSADCSSLDLPARDDCDGLGHFIQASQLVRR